MRSMFFGSDHISIGVLFINIRIIFIIWIMLISHVVLVFEWILFLFWLVISSPDRYFTLLWTSSQISSLMLWMVPVFISYIHSLRIYRAYASFFILSSDSIFISLFDRYSSMLFREV